MKKNNYLPLAFILLMLFAACEKDNIYEPLPASSELKTSKTDKAKHTGFDQWGYNWNAHHFRGYLMNAWFGDEMYPDAPWYKKEPPFDGNVEAYQEAHPEVLEYPFWIYGDMEVVMHWNETSISKNGVYNENILDSDAWITFHYSQGENENRWSQFQKFVAAKKNDEKVIYVWDDNGNPVYGEWFSQEGELLGLYYLWADRILIQVVNTGNLPNGFLPTYKGPLGQGIGKYK
ncbi:hypothetical protein E9993_04960 [Labilibacter sediminis]|nr:hypothetical protein E9993_04960 [Labilibacter sediminis]